VKMSQIKSWIHWWYFFWSSCL